jgi:hypothetical protein
VASFSAWLDLYEEVVGDPGRLTTAACPSCGSRRMRIALVVYEPAANSASGQLWCQRCLTGIQLSRVPIVAGIPVLRHGVIPPEADRIPRYQIVPP